MQSRGGVTNYPRSAHVLTLIGGILILIGGIVGLISAAYLSSAAINLGLGTLGVAVVYAEGAIGVIIGIILLLGASRLKSQPQSSHSWGIIIIILALVSWIGGAGLVIGLILALIGGIMAYVWKPPPAEYGAPVGTAMGASMPGAAPTLPPVGGAKACAYCGAEIPAGAQFCPKCGAAAPA
jgi:hypothetical protein